MPLVSRPWVLPTTVLRLGTMGSRSYSGPSSWMKIPIGPSNAALFPTAFSRKVGASTGPSSMAFFSSKSVRTHPGNPAFTSHGTRQYSIVTTAFSQTDNSGLVKPRLPFLPNVRNFHTSQQWRYDRLQNLEDAANRDRDNANAQAVFLQV